MAEDTSRIWSLRHGTPTPPTVPLRPSGPGARSRALDAAHLRCAALCASTVLQACGIRARPGPHGVARGLGHRAKYRVYRGRGRHVSGLVLRDAERASCSHGAWHEKGARMDARVSAVAAGALARRRGHGSVVARGGEAPSGRTGDVCATKGAGKCVDRSARTRAGVAYWEVWEPPGTL
jgi:hypothetical protein